MTQCLFISFEAVRVRKENHFGVLVVGVKGLDVEVLLAQMIGKTSILKCYK